MKYREIDWESIPTAVTDEEVVLEFKKLESWAEEASEIEERGPLAVEIGSYLGRSTAMIAQFYRVLAFDLWGTGFELGATSQIDDYGKIGMGETWPVFLENMKKFDLLGNRNKQATVIPICSTSEVLYYLTNLEISFAFVDAEHTYPAAYIDLIGVSRHIVLGGLIALHDYKRPGWLDPDPWIGNAQSVDAFLSVREDFRIREHYIGIICLEKWK